VIRGEQLSKVNKSLIRVINHLRPSTRCAAGLCLACWPLCRLSRWQRTKSRMARSSSVRRLVRPRALSCQCSLHTRLSFSFLHESDLAISMKIPFRVWRDRDAVGARASRRRLPLVHSVALVAETTAGRSPPRWYPSPAQSTKDR
jgi:hypothetical protein